MKDRRIGRFAFLFVIVSGLSLFVTPVDAVRIRNFHDDPDLAKAMEYDRQVWRDRDDPNKIQTNLTLAEQHYLIYLKRETESFQRARVCARLGILFIDWKHVADREFGFEKGYDYFRKVLEEEPFRIADCTLRARYELIMAPANRSEQLDAAVKCYALLLSLDENAIRSRWLPETPQDTIPGDLQVQKVIHAVHEDRRAWAYNMVVGSKFLPNRNQWLREIMERFPGTEAADLAQKALAKLDSSVQPPVQEPPAAPQAAGPPIKRPGMSRLIADPNGLALSGKPITLSAAPRQPSQEPVPLATAKPASGRRFPWWLPVLGVAALILAAGGYYRWGS